MVEWYMYLYIGQWVNDIHMYVPIYMYSGQRLNGIIVLTCTCTCICTCQFYYSICSYIGYWYIQ